MWIWIRKVVLVLVVVGWVSPVLGEYYQYRDQDGVLRFTDDISSVPPDQRPEVKTHQSVVSEDVQQPAAAEAAAQTIPTDDSQPSNAGQSGEATWQEKIARGREELNRTQAELNKLYADLRAEQSALEAKRPPESAPFKEKAAYKVEVEALNAKIADYEAQLDAFNQKVDEYNAQLTK